MKYRNLQSLKLGSLVYPFHPIGSIYPMEGPKKHIPIAFFFSSSSIVCWILTFFQFAFLQAQDLPLRIPEFSNNFQYISCESFVNEIEAVPLSHSNCTNASQMMALQVLTKYREDLKIKEPIHFLSSRSYYTDQEGMTLHQVVFSDVDLLNYVSYPPPLSSLPLFSAPSIPYTKPAPTPYPLTHPVVLDAGFNFQVWIKTYFESPSHNCKIVKNSGYCQIHTYMNNHWKENQKKKKEQDLYKTQLLSVENCMEYIPNKISQSQNGHCEDVSAEISDQVLNKYSKRLFPSLPIENSACHLWKYFFDLEFQSKNILQSNMRNYLMKGNFSCDTQKSTFFDTELRIEIDSERKICRVQSCLIRVFEQPFEFEY